MGQAVYITGTSNRTGVQLRNLYALTDCVIVTATTPFATGSLNGQTIEKGGLIRTLVTQIQLSSGVMVAEQSVRPGIESTGEPISEPIVYYESTLMGAIDWSIVGVGHGAGIPDLSSNVVDLTQAPYNIAEGLGQPSQTTALNSALTALGNMRSGDLRTNTMVGYLPEGNYNIGTGILVDRCVLMGDPGATFLHLGGKVSFDRALGNVYEADVDDAEIVKGQTQITISGASAGNMNVGQWFRLTEDDDGTIVNPFGIEDQGDPWNPYGDTPSRNRGQQLEVTAVEDNGDGTYDITFTPGLFTDFTPAQNPKVEWFGVTNRYCGLQDIVLRSADYDNPLDHLVDVYRCKDWWMKGVKTKMANASHIDIRESMCGEIDEWAIEDTGHFTPGGGYGIEFGLTPCQTLIRDGYAAGVRSPIIISGGAGNVIVENYLGHHVNYTNQQMRSIVFHACYPNLFLIENNECEGTIGADFIHGNNANNLFFRNIVRGRSTDPRTGLEANSRNNAVQVYRENYGYEFIGNVFGWAGMSGVYLVDDENRSDATPYIFVLGYDSDGDYSGAGNDAQVPLQTTIHCNFDHVDSETKYLEGEETELKDSIYYDAVGSIPAHLPVCNFKTGAVSTLPAKQRFIDAGGVGSLEVSGDGGVALLSTWTAATNTTRDVYFNESHSTLYVAMNDKKTKVYDITNDEITYETVLTTSGSAFCLHEFDGYLWVGSTTGGLSCITMANNGGTVGQTGTVCEFIIAMADNGSFLFLAGRNGLYSIESTGSANFSSVDSVLEATVGGEVFGVAAIGSDVFYTDSTNGHVRYATVDVSGNLTDDGIKATSVSANKGMYVDADNLYVGKATKDFMHFSRGASGALTLEATYTTADEVNYIRIADGRLYVACDTGDCIIYNQEVDGSLTQVGATEGLSKGEAVYPYGTAGKFFYANGGDGVNHYQFAIA